MVGWLVRCNRGRGAARLQIRGGERVGGQKPETEHDGSVLGCIRALRGGGGWYVVIAPFLASSRGGGELGVS